jgi:hypothetical protein
MSLIFMGGYLVMMFMPSMIWLIASLSFWWEGSVLVHWAACVADVSRSTQHVGEHEAWIPVRDPVGPEQMQCLLRKRDKAVLASFPSPYVHLHPPAVDVPDFEMDALVQTQTHAVDCEETDTVPQLLYRVYKQSCLFDCQDVRHCLELRGFHYFNPVPFTLQDMLPEKLDPVAVYLDGAPGMAVDKIREIKPHLVLAHIIRTPVKILGKTPDRSAVAVNRLFTFSLKFQGAAVLPVEKLELFLFFSVHRITPLRLNRKSNH